MPMSPRLLRPRQTGFDPRSISGLGLWLDASADSSLTFNASTVSEWRDLSGNGRHFAQETGASQPVANTRTQNGRRALDFQGAQFMLGNAASRNVLRNVSGGTAFVAGKIDATSGSQVFFAATRNGSNSQARLVIDTDAAASSWRSGGRRLDADGFAGTNSAGSWDTNVNVLTAVLDYGNSDAFLYENGTLLNSNTSFQTNGSTSDTDSDAVQIGATGGGLTSILDGVIAEIILYRRALSAAERQRVERYLGRKWGITLAPQVSNADAQDWINRVYANGGTVSEATAAAVNTFCNAIDAAGIRDRFFRLNLFAGNSDANLAAVRTPLYLSGSLGGAAIGNAIDTNVNFVQADYQETGSGGGLKGNGTTKYLNTGFNASTAIPSSVSAHLSYSGTSLETSGNAIALGTYSGSLTTGGFVADVYAAYAFGRPARIGAVGSGSFPNITSPAAAESHYVATRTSATALSLYQGGSLFGTTTTSQTPVFYNGSVFVFALNDQGAVAAYTAARLRMYSIGNGLTAAQALAFSNAVIAFNTALGRA